MDNADETAALPQPAMRIPAHPATGKKEKRKEKKASDTTFPDPHSRGHSQTTTSHRRGLEASKSNRDLANVPLGEGAWTVGRDSEAFRASDGSTDPFVPADSTAENASSPGELVSLTSLLGRRAVTSDSKQGPELRAKRRQTCRERSKLYGLLKAFSLHCGGWKPQAIYAPLCASFGHSKDAPQEGGGTPLSPSGSIRPSMFLYAFTARVRIS